MSRKRIGGVLALLFLLLCALALIDGGEEPLHPIEQAVELPESAQ